jgi:GNAT superfamily N-acetyltransferase
MVSFIYPVSPLDSRESITPARLQQFSHLYMLVAGQASSVKRDDISRIVDSGNVLLVVRSSTDEFIGMCTVGFTQLLEGTVATIRDLAVLPAHQGQSLGQKLCLAATMVAKSREVVRIEGSVTTQKERQLLEPFHFKGPVPSVMWRNPRTFAGEDYDTTGIRIPI